MIWDYAVKGILIGLIFGVPAGAIGALTIQRTLEKGFLSGFLTGAGSSAADLLYAAVGIFGIAVISDFLASYQHIFQMSGGPALLFADEPTGALNKANTKEVLNLFTGLHKEGQTILLVTHDKEAALRGNRILYIEDGRVLSELTLSEYDKKDDSREKELAVWLEGLGW